MEISTIQIVSGDCIKITISTGLSFFLRTIYLQNFPLNRLAVGESLTEEDYADLQRAGLAFAAEHDALNYLARAEQCKYILTGKLLKKKHLKESIDTALRYLEKKKYLSDSRFAEAWLRNRKITKAEGRQKLAASLAQKGISREVIQHALDAFFEYTSEEELFERAVLKLKRLGKKDEKLQKALLRAGFPWSLIKHIKNDLN
ncbi:MAG TPA: regulatory protein RecX [Treponemataceae bacterium]|nr:regulatory protein RecX [Treponemataceae bacterium]